MNTQIIHTSPLSNHLIMSTVTVETVAVCLFGGWRCDVLTICPWEEAFPSQSAPACCNTSTLRPFFFLWLRLSCLSASHILDDIWFKESSVNCAAVLGEKSFLKQNVSWQKIPFSHTKCCQVLLLFPSRAAFSGDLYSYLVTFSLQWNSHDSYLWIVLSVESKYSKSFSFHPSEH